MEKERARVLLPDGTIAERIVRGVVHQIGPLCMGALIQTVIYKNEKYYVKDYHGPLDARYELDGKVKG